MQNFKKILTVFVLIFLSISFKTQAEVVNEVEVGGNQRISLETIIVFGDITKGKNYESSDINLLIKKLYDTNYFTNISVELENGKMSITVEENAIINSIVFNGERANKYKKKLSEFLTLKEKSSFMENYV